MSKFTYFLTKIGPGSRYSKPINGTDDRSGVLTEGRPYVYYKALLSSNDVIIIIMSTTCAVSSCGLLKTLPAFFCYIFYILLRSVWRDLSGLSGLTNVRPPI